MSPSAYLLRFETEAFTRVADRGVEPAQLPSVLNPEGESMAGRAPAERRRVCVSYREATTHVAALGRRRPAAHERHRPVQYGDQALGVFGVGRVEDRPFSVLDDLTTRAPLGCSQALGMRRVRRTSPGAVSA